MFSGIVPFFIKTNGVGAGGYPPVQPLGQYHPPGSPFEGSRRSDSISVEIRLLPTINGRRCLEVKLSDSLDPFFMWQLVMGEEEYFTLKREQALLIDFGGFPYKLIELLQACVGHAREERPVYAAWLSVTAGSEDGRRPSDAVLTITESTSIRQIPHLSLRLGAVNEATMRKHLGEMIRQYRQEVDGLKSRLSGDQYRYNTPTATTGLSDVQYLAERCRVLEEKCAALESGRAYTNPVPPPPSVPQATQTPFYRPMADVYSNDVVSLRSALQAANEARRLLEDANGRLQDELAKREAGGHEAKQEIGKANEIIKKLQEELRSTKARLRGAENLLRQQEKLTKDSQVAHDTLRAELLDAKAQLVAKTKEASDLESANKALNVELDEAKKLLEANDKVIDWLHQQINAEQLERITDQARYGLTDLSQLSEDFWRRQAAKGDAAAAAATADQTSF